MQALRSYTETLRLHSLEHSHIRFNAPVIESTMERFFLELDYLCGKNVCSFLPPFDSSMSPITVHLTSPGGSVYHSLAIYDAIVKARQDGFVVNILVEGYAASAASMIVLQAATTRQALPHTRFLLHDLKRWLSVSPEALSEMKDALKEFKIVDKQVRELLGARCGKTAAEVRKAISRKELWMSSTEAVEWGLLDEIIGGDNETGW